MGFPNAPQYVQHVLPSGEYEEDINKAAVCYVWCHYEPSDGVFCEITLVLV